MKIASIRPAWRETSNRFTFLFANAVQGEAWRVDEFAWSWRGLLTPNVILIHWPDELFTAETALARAKAWLKIALLRLAKAKGARLVWLVHEAKPHDEGMRTPHIADAFVRMLDGVMYLSAASRISAEGSIPRLRDVPALVTRHGDYRADMRSAVQAPSPPGAVLRLVFFGQVRPYKNLEALIAAACAAGDEVQVTILGWCKDPSYARALTELAGNASAVRLDLRDRLAPQEDLERAIDRADAVILPYRDIMNSGAALFALSRNRPLIAPRIGALPDLEADLGSEWAWLYEGALTASTLRRAAKTLRGSPGRHAPDLSRYQWPPIGASIRGFFDQLCDSQVERALDTDARSRRETDAHSGLVR